MSARARHGWLRHALPRGWLIGAGIAVMLAQMCVPAYMIASRYAILTSGREIVLETVPVDPRSLFRGDYVTLRYAISQFDRAVAAGGEDLARNDRVYAVLAPGADGAWAVRTLARARPQPREGEIVLKGRVKSVHRTGDTQTVRLGYGIESYFVPEGEGKALEDMVRERALSVIVAIDRDANAAIKGLVIAGERIYDEPLF